MKKAAMIAAVLTLVLALSACGNRDKTNDNQSNSNGTTSGDTNGTAGTNGSDPGGMNGTAGTPGTSGTNTPGTNGNGTNGTTGTNSNGTNGTTGTGRSALARDASRAANGVRNAVDDVLTGGASKTSFQRMLDNARVHDTDGILTDGENSRW